MVTRVVPRSAVAGMTWVTVGAMIANLAGYLMHLPAGRWLGPDGYGEFASLLTVQLVLAVPALALQTVVARELVRGASTAALRRLAVRCALLVALLAALVTPGLAAALDVGVGSMAAALAAAPALVLVTAEQGLLQGASRFVPLAVVLGGAGIARVAPVVIVLALGYGPAPALAASAAGSATAALAARWFTPNGDSAARDAPTAGVASVVMASQVQLALIAMSSLDLVVARIVLDRDQAGLYALGAVATKAAFWLPQAVGMVLYPRMANPRQSAAALRSALTVLAALGVLAVLGVALASPLVPFLVGDDYAPVQNLLWAFAADGAVLSVLQGALLAAIAGERTRLALVAWLGLAVELTLMFTLADSVATLIAIALSGAVATTLIACALALRAASVEA